MNQWYYAKGGEQHGPVTVEQLQALLQSGAVDPVNDLCWNPTMSDWLPVAQIPELSGGAAPVAAAGDAYGSQPFAYQTATGALEEIVPGSEPIIPTACVKRAWDLTVKHIGPLLAVVVVYIAITFAVSFVVGFIGGVMGMHSPAAGSSASPYGASPEMSGGQIVFSIVSNVISNLVSVFLGLGMVRIGLNIVSGKPFSIGMLFGQGDKLFRAFFGGILFGMMVVIGLVLLVVPGIYLALRFGQYMNAIVDKDMGIMDSFAYSSRITENNRMNIFVIFLFAILISVAGCLAFIVGLLFAYPMTIVMWLVAYRWMQYGGRVVLDDPMTQQPLLASLPD